MATFAKLDITNTVTKLIKIGNDVPTSNGPLGENDMHVDGEKYCNKLLGGNWKQSSMQGLFRQRAATIGGTYDFNKDVFIDEQPHLSWTLDSDNNWQPPVVCPTSEQSIDNTNVIETNPDTGETIYGIYVIDWDEENQKWIGRKLDGTILYWNPNTSSWEE